jgi:parallel beta-helix repeat protein
MRKNQVLQWIRLATSCIAALGAATASAATLHVPADLPTIQAAIDAAQDGDSILVAPGTYLENLALWDKDITLESESGAEATIVDGQGLGSVLMLEHLPDHGARVSGFTFRNGVAIYGGGGISGGGGADLIENNIIVDNSAPGQGGGIYLGSSDATVRHNRIARNVSKQWAGGISMEGGIIEDNVIEDNRAGDHGGGLVMSLDMHAPLVRRNVIRRNSSAYGGGVYVTFGNSARFFDNLVYGNAATTAGGGVDVSMLNGHRGGRWVNNTIADNTAPAATQLLVEGRARKVTFINNAIVGPATAAAVACQADAPEYSPRFTTNDVYAGGLQAAEGACAASAAGGDNLSVAPGFVDAAVGKPYHLSPTSPLVDAGTNDAVAYLHRDFAGHPRIVDGGHGAVVDIGAFEYVPQ